MYVYLFLSCRGLSPSTWLVVDVKLEVGDVDVATVLMEVDHVRIHPRQVEDKLREPHRGQLDRQLSKTRHTQIKSITNNPFFLFYYFIEIIFLSFSTDQMKNKNIHI